MLPYHQLSTGPQVLLAFHGIGQDHRCFMPLARAVEGRYTLYAFDLFFHGPSPVEVGEETLSLSHWQELIRSFLEKERIGRFSVLGFSMGGRFALATAAGLPDQLDRLLLIAPEGITVNPWYNLATGSAAGRKLFRFFLDHMPLFHRLGQALSTVRLLDRSTLRFAENVLATPQQRRQVYQSWLAFRKLRVNLDTLAQELNQHVVPVHFYLGFFDRIIPASAILPLSRRLQSHELTVLRAGHNRLIEKMAEQF